ncbi:hypothetical protein D3C83_73690 [compost metagenome]
MPEALPAVTEPSFLNAARSFAMPSTLASARGCSSRSNTVVPLRVFISIGRIWSLK